MMTGDCAYAETQRQRRSSERFSMQSTFGNRVQQGANISGNMAVTDFALRTRPEPQAPNENSYAPGGQERRENWRVRGSPPPPGLRACQLHAGDDLPLLAFRQLRPSKPYRYRRPEPAEWLPV